MKAAYHFKPEHVYLGFKDLMDTDMRSVTVFCDPDLQYRVKITRIGRMPNEWRVTAGKPAYYEREFIRLCKKAGAKPKKTWLRPFPKRNTKKS